MTGEGARRRDDGKKDARARHDGSRSRKSTLSGTNETDRLVLAEQIKQEAERLSARTGKHRVAFEDQGGILARGTDIVAVTLQAHDTKRGIAALPRAEHVAFPAQPQILLGDAKTVFGLAQDGKPRPRGFPERRL